MECRRKEKVPKCDISPQTECVWAPQDAVEFEGNLFSLGEKYPGFVLHNQPQVAAGPCAQDSESVETTGPLHGLYFFTSISSMKQFLSRGGCVWV